jgi:putative Mg2+ transporter-C (MgtC) family protein
MPADNTLIDPIAQLFGDWAIKVTVASTVLKLVIAVFFAAIIGYERVRRRHAVGLRTFMVVSISSTAIAIADLYLITAYNVSFSFLSAAAIIGLAIIGTNTILFSSRNQLKGVTTTVELMAAAIVSVVLGLGLYTVAICAYIILIICLTLFTYLESFTKRRSNCFTVHIELNSRNSLQEFTQTIRKFGLRIDDIDINPAYSNSGLGVYSMSLTIIDEELKKKPHSEIITALSALDCVFYVEEIS